VNLVAVLHLEIIELAPQRLFVALPRFPRLIIVFFSCAVSRCTSMCRSAAAGRIPPPNLEPLQAFLFAQLVLCRPANHSFTVTEIPSGGTRNDPAFLQPLNFSADSCSSKS